MVEDGGLLRTLCWVKEVTQNPAYSMVSFMRVFVRDRKQIGGCFGLEDEGEFQGSWLKGFLLEIKRSKLNCGDGYTYL